MKKENVVVKKNTAQHLAPGGRGWHAVPGEGVLKEAGLMGTPSSPLQGTFPARGEVNGGFTLIELLVVVLIIGILAAVALPQYQIAVAKSRFATLKHIVKSVSDAQKAYYLANNEYANDFDALDVDMPQNTIVHEYTEDETNVEAKKKRQRYYDWGYCYTSNGAVACYNDLIGIRYTIHASGVQECVAYNTHDETSIAARVCKIETNATPTKAATNKIPIMRYYY